MKFQNIDITKIHTNPKNPRGLKVEEDPKKDYLRQSIRTFGILVPLVVVRHGTGFMLIDGERRYWAARSLGLTTVPAYILASEMDDREILVRMFQIHHNREQWGAIQQCKAIEDWYSDASARLNVADLPSDEVRLETLATALEAETGIEYRTASDRMLFLRWPRRFRDRMYLNPKEENYTYACEIERFFILPALRGFPEYFQHVPTDEVREALYDKIKAHTVVSGKEVRLVAPILKFAPKLDSDRKKVVGILDRLVKQRGVSYQDAMSEFGRAFPAATAASELSPRTLLSSVEWLRAAIEAFDVGSFQTSVRRSKANVSDVINACHKLTDALEGLITRLHRG